MSIAEIIVTIEQSEILILEVLILSQAKFSPLFISYKGKISDVVINNKKVTAATTKLALVGYFIMVNTIDQ